MTLLLVVILFIYKYITFCHIIDAQKIAYVKYDGDNDYPSGFTFIQTKEQLHSIVSCDSDELLNSNQTLDKHWVDNDSLKLARQASYTSCKRLKLLSKKSLDLTKYNYIITYGFPIDYVYYSLYNTLFKDDSPWKKEAFREYKNLLCIKYKNGMTSFDRFTVKGDGLMYLYQTPKSYNIRPYYGP